MGLRLRRRLVFAKFEVDLCPNWEMSRGSFGLVGIQSRDDQQALAARSDSLSLIRRRLMKAKGAFSTSRDCDGSECGEAGRLPSTSRYPFVVIELPAPRV